MDCWSVLAAYVRRDDEPEIPTPLRYRGASVLAAPPEAMPQYQWLATAVDPEVEVCAVELLDSSWRVSRQRCHIIGCLCSFVLCPAKTKRPRIRAGGW